MKYILRISQQIFLYFLKHENYKLCIMYNRFFDLPKIFQLTSILVSVSDIY